MAKGLTTQDEDRLPGHDLGCVISSHCASVSSPVKWKDGLNELLEV